jgi:lipocalin
MKIKIFVMFFIIAGICPFLACKKDIVKIDKTPVDSLNIQKYLGTWFEIARFDHSFERNLTGVTATYTLKDDGSIKVVNQGYENTLKGNYKKAEGKAKIPDTNKPSRLRVSFFWIFYSDYLVLELDPDYQWALIGSSSDKYLWILSRTPELPDSVFTEILAKAKKRGYDTSKLIKVLQKRDL